MRAAPGKPSQSHSEIVIVANEVSGLGGMEQQLRQLVIGLLDAGRRVTVIARACDLDRHENLSFEHVPGPKRPFTLAYPVFFVVASVLAARHRGAILHTTGAIVANRADLSSVHYCHRAASSRLATPRASRDGRLYRANARIATKLSSAGERWCYRPWRTKMLCAVSPGLATELRANFPGMGSRVHTVPNGVDTTEFRPDATAGPTLRAQLRIETRARLALFAGGDWDRKGLRYAIDALVHAPGWHLVVAGDGERDDPLKRAHRAGTKDRLHFLGPVTCMAPVYAAADAFILPTAYETFSLVSYEAAASGLPLLVTCVNGVEDLLSHGRNGWFITQDAQDIAGRLTALGADTSLARKMSAEARSGTASFSWEAMVIGYLAAYAQVSRS